jgi:hypothetical protein
MLDWGNQLKYRTAMTLQRNLTSLHPKTETKTKEREEECQREEALGRAVILLVSGSEYH